MLEDITPIASFKSQKNAVEREGMKNSHVSISMKYFQNNGKNYRLYSFYMK